MKKLLMFLAVVLAVCLGACTDAARTQLRTQSELLNRQCPVQVGSGISIKGVEYNTESNDLVLTYVNDETIGSVSALRNAGDAQRRFLANFLTAEANNKFFDLIVKAKAGITIDFVGAVSGDTASIHFSQEEIAELSSNRDRKVDDREQLENIVAITNAQCPIQLDGEALVLTNVALSEHNLEFHYSFDSEVYDPQGNSEFEDILFEGLSEELTESSNDLQLELMKKLDVGVTYIMKPTDGGAPVIIEFSDDRIKAIN